MFTILLVGLVFVFWAFFSFFVHVLVAVFFPVLAGLLLGFWIYMWRNVKAFFHALGDDGDLAGGGGGGGGGGRRAAAAGATGGTVYRKLPAGSGTRSLLMT